MSRRSGHDSGPSSTIDDDGDAQPGRVRLDKWLWAARFYKTRVLAAEAIDGGKVDVNGDRAKRAKQVGANDIVRLRQGPVEWELRVKDVAERRGPAEVAQRLYEETPDGRARRERVQEQLRTMPSAFAYGESRPGKRDRRELRRLKGDL